MSKDCCSFVLSHIDLIVNRISKRAVRNSVTESEVLDLLVQLISTWGRPAELHLIACLLSAVDFTYDNKGQPKTSLQCKVLSQLFVLFAVTKPKAGFLSNFCEAFETPNKSWSGIPLAHITRTLRLNPSQEALFGLCLTNCNDSSLRKDALIFVCQSVPGLVKSYSDPELAKDTGLQDCAVEIVHTLLTSIADKQKLYCGVTNELLANFVATLKRDFPADGIPAVLLPWLASNQPVNQPKYLQTAADGELVFDISATAMDFTAVKQATILGSIALQIEEIGYAFTSSVESCKRHIESLQWGQLTASNVAHIIAMIIRTHTGLKSSDPLVSVGWLDDKGDGAESLTWNVQTFACAVRELNPSVNWAEVVVELDHPGFIVRDRTSLNMLCHCLLEGLGHNVFPIALLYKEWSNKEGQLSWIMRILQHPDVFCLADYPRRIVQIETLKNLPDESKELLTWRSLDLIETLLTLGESSTLFGDVLNVFRWPIQNCPDVLMLALIQTPVVNACRHELLRKLTPVFLSGHPNSMTVLLYAWSSNMHSPQSLQNVILHSMAEWYLSHQDDQTKLTRILEIAHELKALQSLLNSPEYMFAIDLACLASRRDFLKLDKWLCEKISDNGEPFVIACLQLLKRRASSGLSSGVDKVQQLPMDIVTAFVTALQGALNNVSQPVSTEIVHIVTACQQALGKTTAAPIPSSMAPLSFGSNPGRSSAMELFGGSGAGSASTRYDQSLLGFGSSGVGAASGGIGELGSRNVHPFSSGSITPNPPSGVLGQGHQTSVSPARSLLQSANPLLGLSNRGSSWGPSPSLPTPSLPTPSLPTPSLPTPAPRSVASSSFMHLTSSSQHPIAAPGSLLGGTSSSGVMSGLTTASSSAPGPPGASASDPDYNQVFSDEVQEDANAYFQQIYSQPPQPTMSVEDFILHLINFRDSKNQKQKDVFACMIKNLFEEYRFFPEYPDRELYTTALVYGSIVRENVLSGFALAYVMRALQYSVAKDISSKMYWFGLVGIDQFKHRLKEFMNFSQSVMQLPHISQLPKHLVEYLTAAAHGQDPKIRPEEQEMSVIPPSLRSVVGLTIPRSVSQAPSDSTSPRKPAPLPGRTTDSGPSLTTTSINTLVSATEKEGLQVTIPPDHVLDKIAFLFNNLSQANLTTKVAEMWKNALNEKDDHLPWLSQYLVMKRVSIEPNFHHLYCNFLNEFNHLKFFCFVLEETHRNIRILLRSDKRQAVSNFSDRQLLKSLGHWLGMITVGKNRAILFEDLDIKSLILEAYYKGQQELLYVVPFVAKILESCQKSAVFQYPNAWTQSILNVLAELHQEPDLKLNLKFEIEVLCKCLSVDLANLKPGNLLKDTDRLVTLKQQLDDVMAISKQPIGSVTGPSPIPLHATESSATGRHTNVHHDQETSTTNAASAPTPPPAKFSYHDVNVTNFQGMTPHLVINTSLPLFQMNPVLKNMVRTAIEHAVQELIGPVTERAIKVAMTTTEHVIRKDFALEADERKMQGASHHMVRSLTAAMAMITCREPLLITIQQYLRSTFSASIRGANPEQLKMIEEAALVLAEDNVELAQCFIVKTACERALPEIDKRLSQEFDLRRNAKSNDRRYCDPGSLTYQAERMPEPIRLKVGSITPSQQTIYEEFSHHISGFKPTTADDLIPGMSQSINMSSASTESSMGVNKMQPVPVAPSHVPVNSDEAQLETVYLRLGREIDQILVQAQDSAGTRALRSMRDAVVQAAQSVRDNVAAQSLVGKLVEQLLGAYRPSNEQSEADYMKQLTQVFVVTTNIIAKIFGGDWLREVVTKVLINCRQEFRFNLDAVDVLIRSNTIIMEMYDKHVASSIQEGMNFMACNFAQRLVQRYLRDQTILQPADLQATTDTLQRVINQSQARPAHDAPSSANIMDMLRVGDRSSELSQRQTQFDAAQAGQGLASVGQRIKLKDALSGQQVANDDPPDLQQKVEQILRYWLELCYTPAFTKEPSKVFSTVVQLLHSNGILRTDDMITRFFRICTEMCADLCYRLLMDPSNQTHLVRSKCFYTLDGYVRLIALLFKHSGDGKFSTKLHLLEKVLRIIAESLLQDHEVRQTEFHQLPYHRMLIMLFYELTQPDPLLNPINYQILDAFCKTLTWLQPRKAPAFAFGWLDIVGNRQFIGRMLVHTPQQKAWPLYANLIIDQLRFLAPFLRNIDLPKAVALMYKGTLRVLLVLLHDFPELLCEYHYMLCDVIPPNCVQLRNLILSAYPRNMRLPDPFMPNLKVDQLPEITASPRINWNLQQLITEEMRNNLDSYLANRAPVEFLADLRSKLQVSSTPGHKYNTSLMNAIVLYVGMKAIEAIQGKEQRPSISTIAHTAFMDIFQSLAVDLDTEGRYLFFNAIANQLRYPNSHTHYFSCTLLYLFQEANSEMIQEQITRILFERLVALRPHPWGLLITFIELIKNKDYKFWNHNFVCCAPEIEKLFESVAASCFAKEKQLHENASSS